MKHIIILLLCLVFIGSSFSQEKANSICMSIDINYRSPNHYFKLTISSPNEKPVWNFDSKENSIIDSNYTFTLISANNWYTVPGKYLLTIEMTDKISLINTNSVLEYNMNGNEYNAELSILFNSFNRSVNQYVSNFHLLRYYISYDSVTINERWLPSSKGSPLYTVINNSKSNITGTELFNNFFGVIEKFESGVWKLYERGRFCGTSVSDGYIVSGDSVFTDEGAFIGGSKPFTNGRYKYCVYYSYSKVDKLWRINPPNKEIPIEIYDIYLLEKEFTITDN